MEDIDNRQNVYNYDWKWELMQNLKTALIWLLKVGAVLFVLIMLLKNAPFWLFSMVLGAMIFAVPAWVFVKSFFKVDYMIFIVADLEKKELTPYFIPAKLIKEGVWGIEGVKSKYKSMNNIIDDKEIEHIFKEMEKTDIKIMNLENEKEKLKDELKFIRVNRKKWNIGKVDKIFLKLGLKNIAKAVNPDELEKYEKSRIKLEMKIEELNYMIQDLRKEKNRMLMDVEWIGEYGDSVFIADKVDKKTKKIYLAPLHACSDLELQLNKHKFNELKTKLSSMIKEYATMKINYNDNVLMEAVNLLEHAEKEKEAGTDGDDRQQG